MSYYDTHAAGFQTMQNLLGEACPTIQWKGADWKIIPDSLVLDKKLRQGGFVFDADNALVLHALRSQFADQEPDAQQEITYSGREYRIDAKQILPGNLIIRLVCSDVNGAAGG